jgi:uncharacterized protein YkwD
MFSDAAFTGLDAGEEVPSPSPIAAPEPTPTPYWYTNPTDSDYREIAEAVIRYTNLERENNGLLSLELDEDLMLIAQVKTDDMVTADYFSHDSPTWNGNTGTIFPLYMNSQIQYWGENILLMVRATTTDNQAKATVDSWMKSSGHKANILREDTTHIGVGVRLKFDAKYNNYVVILTEVFGKV